MSQLFTEPGTHRSATKFRKCTTCACDTVRTIFSLEPCMRRHEVSRAHKTKTLRAVTKLKGKGINGTGACHQSATQDLNKVSILCDSQKYTACLDVHCSAYQRNERDEDLLFVCLPLSYAQGNRHLLHTITAMGIWASPSRLTYAAENSRKHHQTLDIHAKTEKMKKNEK